MTRKVTLAVNGLEVASGVVPQDYLDNPHSPTRIRLDPDSLAIERGLLLTTTVLYVDLHETA